MKNVMTRAWKIAREGQKKFGGKVKEYFQQALVMAWAEAKAPKKVSMEEVAELLKEKLAGTAKVNTWERYGKRRIYVNKGFKQQVAMLEFDNSDNLITEMNIDNIGWFGAQQNGIFAELETVVEVVKGLVA